MFKLIGKAVEGSKNFLKYDGKQITVSDNGSVYTTTLVRENVITPDIVSVYVTQFDGLQLVWDSERFNSRDALASVADRKGITAINSPFALLGFTETACCALVVGDVAADYCDVEVQDISKPRELLVARLPGLASVVAKNRAKRNMVAHINPLDSLAALEKQVDLLTMLVLSLARKQPAAEQPAWLDELETVFNDTSSVQEDALEKVVASMGEYKAHIRALQEEYFRNRSTT